MNLCKHRKVIGYLAPMLATIGAEQNNRSTDLSDSVVASSNDHDTLIIHPNDITQATINAAVLNDPGQTSVVGRKYGSSVAANYAVLLISKCDSAKR